MADVAAARREARRKRILENSHNRLELIAGKKSSENCSLESSSKYSHSNHDFEASAASSARSSVPYLTSINNGLLSPEPESYALTSETHSQIAAGDTEIANDFAGFTPAPPEIVKSKFRLENLISYKYDVVILALLMQLMYNIFVFETTYFFLPLVMYTVTKLIWFPTQNNFNFASAVLLMNGISANKASKIISVGQWVAVISQDICVYLFITICIQSLLFAFENYLVIT